MKFTVIGYYGGAIKANSAASSYLLENQFGKILLDCGPGSVSMLQNKFDLRTINDVIITHYHYDHFSDIGALMYHRLIMKGIGKTDSPLSVYAQDDKVISTTLDMGPATQLHFIDENSNLLLYGMEIDFMVTKHPVKCLAVRIKEDNKTIVYTADSAFMGELVEFSKNADLLIVENSLYNGYNGTQSGHMNTNDTAKLINESAAKQVVLTHLPIYGNPEEILDAVTQETTVSVKLADNFLEIEL